MNTRFLVGQHTTIAEPAGCVLVKILQHTLTGNANNQPGVTPSPTNKISHHKATHFISPPSCSGRLSSTLSSPVPSLPYPVPFSFW